MILNNIYETIGKTPMVRITKIVEPGMAEIVAKLEAFNPSGSVKDRASIYMIEQAERDGKLKAGDTMIEPTSGNTGIALSMIGAAKGYEVILVMPETMSMERRNLMKAYGAKLILTEGKLGMSGSVEEAKKLAKENGYFMPSQFTNISNVNAHYDNTGLEIIEATEGKIDAFVAGVGTGGTVSGAGKRLKEYNKNILVVAVQPAKSPVLTGGAPSGHKIQGLGANFVPEIYNKDEVDEIIDITEEESFEYARRLGKEEGILSGISAGGNLAAAIKIAKGLGEGKRVVVILPDTGERYLSTELFTEN